VLQHGHQFTPPARVSEIDQSLLHLLHRARQCAEALLQAELTELDLTPPRFFVLASLPLDGGLSHAQLCKKTSIDRSTMTEIMRSLVQNKLVGRVRDKKDTRAYVVTITSKGLEALDLAQRRAAIVEDTLLAMLTPSQAENFIKALSGIVASFSLPALRPD
jgi:DNA-binding MarR family transcriptional regulator